MPSESDRSAFLNDTFECHLESHPHCHPECSRPASLYCHYRLPTSIAHLGLPISTVGRYALPSGRFLSALPPALTPSFARASTWNTNAQVTAVRWPTDRDGCLKHASAWRTPRDGLLSASVCRPRQALVLTSNLGLAYIAHYNAPAFYRSLEERSEARFGRVCAYSFGVLTLLCTRPRLLSIAMDCARLLLSAAPPPLACARPLLLTEGV